MAKRPTEAAAPAISNTFDAEKMSEAMAVYEADKGLVDRAQGTLRRHQNYYETEFGITAAQVRARYKESKLSEQERIAFFAEEHAGRRALDLWNAEDGDAFDELIARAEATPTAAGEGASKLVGARAYNDGFNGGAKAGRSQSDNPFPAGSEAHFQWARGCTDGIDFKENLAAPMSVHRADQTREDTRAAPAAPETESRMVEQKKAGRGRPAGTTKEAIAAKKKGNGQRKGAAAPADVPDDDAQVAGIFGNTTGLPH